LRLGITVKAKYIKERVWAGKQRIFEQKDGSIIIEVETSGRDDVKQWILSYGPHAEILGPEDLRKEFIEAINAMLSRYN